MLNQEIGAEILSEMGFQIETADNGQMALDSGMNRHISKPIDIDNLLAALDEMLK